jgi:cytochrome c553
VNRVNIVLGLALAGVLIAAWSADPARKHQVVQLTTPDGQVDRCVTCHRFAGIPGVEANPGKAGQHPAVPGHPRIGDFGCTPCHGGQGRRLDTQAHAPGLGQGQLPFLAGKQLQSRCVRCHVPTGLKGAPALDRGYQHYLDAGCTGCHLPGRPREGLGPDLRRLGRRTDAELRKALLAPRKGHDKAVMWSLRWRFDDKKKAGKADMDDLLVALLAMAEQPGAFRSRWARPTLKWDQDCTGCHRVYEAQAPTAKKMPAVAGRPHRCTFLKRSKTLRCASCHHDKTGPPRRRAGRKRCPQLQAAWPVCAACHNRDARK